MIYNIKKAIYQGTLFFRKLVYTFYSFGKIIVLSSFRNKIPFIDKNEIIVIGNAPSFREDYNQHPEFFKEKDLMCVNNFPSSEYYDKLKPSYLLFLDDSYFPSNNKLQPWAEKTLNAIVEKTTWKMTIFVSQFARRSPFITQLPVKNPNISIHFYNYTVLDGFDWIMHRLFKSSVGMPLCKNVLPAAIFVALNMRYKKIYLSGVENSFFKDIAVDKNNVLFINMSYFYSKDQRSGHFYHNLHDYERMDVSDFFKWCYHTFFVYKKLEVYSKFMNAKIINTTEHSYIDAFERKTISEL